GRDALGQVPTGEVSEGHDDRALISLDITVSHPGQQFIQVKFTAADVLEHFGGVVIVEWSGVPVLHVGHLTFGRKSDAENGLIFPTKGEVMRFRATHPLLAAATALA